MRWDVAFWVSAALNVVLGIALFFKGALNDLLTYWFKSRVLVRQERQRELLLELNARMRAIDRDYFLSIAPLIFHEEPSAIQKQASDALITTNDFLDRHDLEFPRSIRDLNAALRIAMQIKGFNMHSTHLLEKNEVLRITEAVSTAAAKIRAEIERLIR